MQGKLVVYPRIFLDVVVCFLPGMAVGGAEIFSYEMAKLDRLSAIGFGNVAIEGTFWVANPVAGNHEPFYTKILSYGFEPDSVRNNVYRIKYLYV